MIGITSTINKSFNQTFPLMSCTVTVTYNISFALISSCLAFSSIKFEFSPYLALSIFISIISSSAPINCWLNLVQPQFASSSPIVFHNSSKLFIGWLLAQIT